MSLAPSRRINALWLALCAVTLFFPCAVLAQQVSAKRPLTHKDCDNWRSIQGQQLSPDGKFLAYALVPQEGEGEIVVRNLATAAESRYPRGSAPALAGAGRTSSLRPARGSGSSVGGRLAFTADSRILVFQSFPTKAEMEQVVKNKVKPEDRPRGRLNLLDLATGKVTRVEKVKSFQVPEESSTCLVYLRDSEQSETAGPRRPAAGSSERPVGRTGAGRGRGAGRRQPQRPEYGSDMVVRCLADHEERTVPDVVSFVLSKDGKCLVYAVSSKKAETNGIYALAPGSAASPRALLKGKGHYNQLTWDDKQTRLAFLSDRDEVSTPQPKFKVYCWERQGGKEAAALVSATSAGFRHGLVISDKAALTFSQDGGMLFFGVAPAPPPVTGEDGAGASEDKVVVDLWHWKDDYIQPMQKVRADLDRNRTFRAVYHLKDKKYVQLADDKMATIASTQDGGWALGSDDRPYRLLIGHDTGYADYFLVNTRNGSRKPLLRKHAGALTWSPGGKYAVFYDGKNWNSLSLPAAKVVNLTRGLKVKFAVEDWDMPSTPPPYGIAGWTEADKHVLLYDRFDLWCVALDGSAAKNLTAGFGRKHKIQFRYVRLDPREKTIDPRRPLLLRAENEETRDSGFYRTDCEGGDPRNLIMAARSFSYPVKAKNADVLLLSASTFYDYPDLLVTDRDFKDLKRVTNANPQKAKFLWGKAELVRFKNSDGVALSGILIKPENFDPRKRYPLMVYIYEKLSSNLHRFVDPRPNTSINFTYYASNGYLVFLPDIVYTVGEPGPSALKCVLPGIQAVVDKGFVNEKAIGIQGHSWGGYQIAYMITQTNRFKAAAAGAPVSNMTSAYSGIRWESGLPRQWQYERSQSRIGGNLWQYPLRFVDNSPIFKADRVKTPLLMLHNDQDGAVPWYQGIEYFLALRRLGKEVYMFNYNYEGHGLRRRVNQKDYTVRMQQFFDHYLKGAPKPAWLEKGIPYLERDKPREKSRPGGKGTVTAGR
jgi:dipeptidyl aminopeptidase/acylaminoacyl peptidase